MDDLVATPRKSGMPEREPLKWYPGEIRSIERDNSSKFVDSEFKFSIALEADRGQGRDGNDRLTFMWVDTSIPSHDDNRLVRLLRQLDGDVDRDAPVDLRPYIGINVELMFSADGKIMAVKRAA